MKVVCFGDSNTYGFDPRSYYGGRYGSESRWVDIIASKTGWQINNMGQNGLAIPDDEYEYRLYDSMLCNKDVGMLIIMLGSNDLLQGLSAKAVSARMNRFLARLTIAKGKILLVCPPAFKNGLWVPDDKTLEHSAHLAEYYRELAIKAGLSFADASVWGIPLCYDGVHFTESGHRLFAEKILEIILNYKEI